MNERWYMFRLVAFGLVSALSVVFSGEAMGDWRSPEDRQGEGQGDWVIQPALRQVDRDTNCERTMPPGLAQTGNRVGRVFRSDGHALPAYGNDRVGAMLVKWKPEVGKEAAGKPTVGIHVGRKASDLERFAADELSGYLKNLFDIEELRK
jgi:hypothetical protein